MSELTITTAGTTQTAKSGTQVRKGRVIRVLPTVDTTATTANDILFNSTAIPKGVRTKGGTSKLVRIDIYNHLDTTCDIDLFFTEKQVNIGDVNDAIGSGSLWTDALVKDAGYLGVVKFDVSDSEVDMINGLTARWPLNKVAEGPNVMLLQGAENSTDVYFTAVDRTGSITWGANDLEFIFHIEYLD